MEEQNDVDEKNEIEGKKEKNFAKDFLEMVLYVLVVLALCYLIVTLVAQRTKVDGSSMEPTLSDGDNLIVEKLSYHFSDPERFDIIIFPDAQDSSIYYIKRVIGLPGETVWIDESGNIYIDGEILDEDYGLETITNAGNAATPITLGEDEYFVLGDNRNNSLDSRYDQVGLVKRSSIVGRAWIRIYPFSKFGKL